MELKEEYIETFLDDRNVNLWHYLKERQNIKVEVGNYGSCEVFSQGKDSIIYVPRNRVDIPGFTHELLHIFLRTKDIYIGSGLLLTVREKPHMQNVLSESLINHIGNCLSHIKMLPLFIEMGFQEMDFIDDYDVNKLNEEDINDLQKNFHKRPWFRNPYFDKVHVDYYIGKYFAAKACPNSNFDYSNGLGALKSINSELYNILNDFMTEWIAFDINDMDPITGGYFLMDYHFTERLENWILNNRIK
jgi:hypothetical protein